MWNLKKNWYRRSYLQSRNRDRDKRTGYGHQGRKKGDGMNWEIGVDIYILLTLCIK